ncbi:MAG: TIGR03013 family XrtA/PEP-CTERM system glycosyltransferase [Pseudomonadales bacterium]
MHTPILLTALAEGVLLTLAPYIGSYLRTGEIPGGLDLLFPSLTFATVLVVAMLSMGVYEAKIREGVAGMMLRTAVAIFLLGAMATAILSYVLPDLAIGRGVLLLTCVSAFILLAVWRWLTGHFLNEEVFKRRVVVLGTGERALKIAARMRRRVDQRGFVLLGFIEPNAAADTDAISDRGAKVIRINEPLADYCRQNEVDEIVVAMDERRRNGGSGLPLDELMECRLQGVEVCDIQEFIEREAGKVDVDLLRPSWMVFSDGFVVSAWRSSTKRSFDLLASALLLFFVWPIMLITALAIWIESRFRDPILYRQERVGLDGKPFQVLKFRSMATDAEKEGQAIWAQQNDPRVTRIGAAIRKTRIDELPQLFNVLRGNMSFVGPRPERPVFVDELNEAIPYYAQRHRVKPGITGWAQLRYPYGASVDDAKEKLQYDLYYLKNHSLLLDMIILLQTVEVVLVGEGAR